MKRILLTSVASILFISSFAWGWGEGTGHPARRDKRTLDSLVCDYYRSLFVNYADFRSELITNDSMCVRLAKDIPDSVYIKRLSMLNSPVHLPYNNIVRNYITLYANPRGSFRKILGSAEYYMPMFEAELYRQGMPIELKMLPIIESALNPTAISRAGAAGLWQFMYATGKAYGLTQDSYVDMRMDPVASTEAACRYLKDLYRIYDDWMLVLAAYNCGPGNVNKALARAGNAKTYWDIYYFLPAETRGYVPAFIAATYVYTFHKAHDIDIEKVSYPIVTDTIMVSGRNMHFKQISSTIGVSDETLRALNPVYRLDIIPAKSGSYPLVLPMEMVPDFIAREQDILSSDTLFQKEFEMAATVKPKDTGTITHTVKKGEYLGLIAKKYGVSVANLRKWNNISNDKFIRVGQKLKIIK